MSNMNIKKQPKQLPRCLTPQSSQKEVAVQEMTSVLEAKRGPHVHSAGTDKACARSVARLTFNVSRSDPASFSFWAILAATAADRLVSASTCTSHAAKALLIQSMHMPKHAAVKTPEARALQCWTAKITDKTDMQRCGRTASVPVILLLVESCTCFLYCVALSA